MKSEMMSRTHRDRRLLCFVPAFLVVLGTALGQNNTADTVILNAKVFTASVTHPHAEAIAIKGDRILAVDTNQKIESLVGPKTKTIDAAGRLVIRASWTRIFTTGTIPFQL